MRNRDKLVAFNIVAAVVFLISCVFMIYKVVTFDGKVDVKYVYKNCGYNEDKAGKAFWF